MNFNNTKEVEWITILDIHHEVSILQYTWHK